MEMKRSRSLMPPPLVFVDKMIVSRSTVKWILHASVIHVFEYTCKELNTECIHIVFAFSRPHIPELCLWIPVHSRARYFCVRKQAWYLKVLRCTPHANGVRTEISFARSAERIFLWDCRGHFKENSRRSQTSIRKDRRLLKYVPTHDLAAL